MGGIAQTGWMLCGGRRSARGRKRRSPVRGVPVFAHRMDFCWSGTMKTTTPTRNAPPVTRDASEPRFETERLRQTKNDLPSETRAEVAGLLNQRLAECLDLAGQCKQAH